MLEQCPICGSNMVSYDRLADITDEGVTIENFFYCAICDKHYSHIRVGTIAEWQDEGWNEIEYVEEEEE